MIKLLAAVCVLVASVSGQGFETYGAGCAGASTPPAIGASGDPKVGQAYAVQVSNLKPYSVGAFIVGLSKDIYDGNILPFDLTGMGMPGCELLVGWDAEIGFFSKPGGVATWHMVIPNDPLLVGAVYYAQAYVVDPVANVRGIATSNAGKFTIQ